MFGRGDLRSISAAGSHLGISYFGVSPLDLAWFKGHQVGGVGGQGALKCSAYGGYRHSNEHMSILNAQL